MIRPLTLAAAVLVALPATAHAQGDARLVNHRFDPDEVVRIDGRTGVQATIAFAEDEHIENVAIGDSASWQVTPNKRATMLFVKPLTVRARTNMTVVTDRHTYLFDLVAAPAGRALYVLRFSYPDEPKPVRTETPAGLNPDEQQALGGSQPVDPAQLNFAWRSRGSSRLLPARVYDDGHATYLSWAVGTPIPAIQIRDEKGTEGPVNYAVRGDVIVVDGVPPLIVLRSGRDSALLEFKGPARPSGDVPSLAVATAPKEP